MLIDKLFLGDRVPVILKKSLDFQAERNLLISSNIANLNTPGYKAQDINFENQLQQALNMSDQVQPETTDGKHIGPSLDAVKGMRPEVFEETDAARSDGNNVNLDKEMMKLSENQIMYNAVVQIMMKRSSTIRSSISENAAS